VTSIMAQSGQPAPNERPRAGAVSITRTSPQDPGTRLGASALAHQPNFLTRCPGQVRPDRSACGSRVVHIERPCLLSDHVSGAAVDLLGSRFADPVRVFHTFAAVASRLTVITAGSKWQALHLTRRYEVETRGRSCAAIRSVLSVSRPHSRFRDVLACYVEAIRTWIDPDSGPALIWATTARPALYLLVRRMLVDVVPCPDGSYGEAGYDVARQLWPILGVDFRELRHPFVASNLYPWMRQPTYENVRGQSQVPPLFRDHQVFPSTGNRILFFGWFPPSQFPPADRDLGGRR
jgi:hypothetical protein